LGWGVIVIRGGKVLRVLGGLTVGCFAVFDYFLLSGTFWGFYFGARSPVGEMTQGVGSLDFAGKRAFYVGPVLCGSSEGSVFRNSFVWSFFVRLGMGVWGALSRWVSGRWC